MPGWAEADVLLVMPGEAGPDLALPAIATVDTHDSDSTNAQLTRVTLLIFMFHLRERTRRRGARQQPAYY
ncbi:protein of unknown function [Pararobbsia alpina]